LQTALKVSFQSAPPRPWTRSDLIREYSGKVALVRKSAGKRNLSQ
jgi:hypothetical protein